MRPIIDPGLRFTVRLDARIPLNIFYPKGKECNKELLFSRIDACQLAKQSPRDITRVKGTTTGGGAASRLALRCPRGTRQFFSPHYSASLHACLRLLLQGSPRNCASRVLSVIGSQMVVRREGERRIASEFVWCPQNGVCTQVCT